MHFREAMNTFLENLKRLCAEASIPITDTKLDQMDKIYETLVRENEKHNLTRITDPAEAALNHFFDSIIPYKMLEENGKTLDVGSGAGFPALPLAVMRPDVTMTALESVQKKCGHIELAAQDAGIQLQVLCGRAEELGAQDLRESFDDCVTRAVAALPVLVELTAPFVRVGGRLFYYKAAYKDELEAAQGGARKLGIELKDILSMPGSELEHHILVFEKEHSTPTQYPRRYARIRKSPL